jgi:hypothetical protein
LTRDHGNGRVRIEWAITGEGLNFTMAIVPSKTGFGTALIRNFTRSGLLRAEAVYEPAGINWNVALPLTNAEASVKAANRYELSYTFTIVIRDFIPSVSVYKSQILLWSGNLT